MHRVFPSSHGTPASSRGIQFHRAGARDSGEVVTPFMQDGTYPPRNFATLGPSELQPPFTEAYTSREYASLLLNGTGQASNPIRHVAISQSSVFLLNSRSPFFYYAYKEPSSSRSYRVNLPSSLSAVAPTALVVFTSPPASDWYGHGDWMSP